MYIKNPQELLERENFISYLLGYFDTNQYNKIFSMVCYLQTGTDKPNIRKGYYYNLITFQQLKNTLQDIRPLYLKYIEINPTSSLQDRIKYVIKTVISAHEGEYHQYKNSHWNDNYDIDCPSLKIFKKTIHYEKIPIHNNSINKDYLKIEEYLINEMKLDKITNHLKASLETLTIKYNIKYDIILDIIIQDKEELIKTFHDKILSPINRVDIAIMLIETKITNQYNLQQTQKTQNKN